MGGLDIYSDSIHVNLNNPAAYGELKYTTYSLGINYNTNFISSDNENKTLNGAGLDYLSIAIPTKKFGVGFGLIPLTSVGYKIENIVESEEQNLINRFEGNGGVNQVFLSIGLPIIENLRIGATAYYNFGSLNYARNQLLQGVEISTNSEDSSQISGWSYQFSAEVDVILTQKLKARGFLSLQPQSGLNSQNRRIVYTRSSINQSIEEFIEVDLDKDNLSTTTKIMPQKTKFGVGIGQDQKWFLGMQLNLSKLSNFKSEFPKRKNVDYRDASQWIIGGFYIPDYSSLTSYFSRVVYRCGLRVEDLGVLIDNQPINSTVISFGLGLPIRSLSNANVGLEIGTNGSSRNGLVANSSLALRVGLSLNDLWFIKRKYN